MSGTPINKWRDALPVIGFILARALPIALAVVAYFVAESNSEKKDITEDLLNLAIAILVGVALYILVSEFSQRNIYHLLSRTNDAVQQLIQIGGIEIIYDRSETLTKARALHRGATNRVDAMWTLFPYDDELKGYFAQTLQNKDLHTTRIIAAKDVSNEFLTDHLLINYDIIASKQYEIFLVPECNYEAMIIDGNRAALFIYSSLGYGSAFISSRVPDFVQAIQGLISGLQQRAVRIELDPTRTDKFDAITQVVQAYRANP